MKWGSYFDNWVGNYKECSTPVFMEHSFETGVVKITTFMSKKIESIQSKVIEETFKNKEFAQAVSEAIGENLIKAIRSIDDWNFSYEIKNLMSEILFSEEFKEEIKSYAEAYIKDNKSEIKQLVKDKMAVTIINGVTEAADKIGSLLVDKIKDVSKIY
jgi:hypothetical protein